MDVEIYGESKEMLRAAVDSSREDVHEGTIHFGFSDTEDAEPTTWTIGNWQGDAQTVEEVDGKFVKSWVAGVVVGPGALVLAVGEHHAYTKVTMPDGQAVVKYAGKVTVL